MDHKTESKRLGRWRAPPFALGRAVRTALSPRWPAARSGLLVVGITAIAARSAAGVFPAQFELSSLITGDGSAGFVLNGIDAEDRSGQSVSVAGDVNGDGIDDLIIGARNANQASGNLAGESYVVFGRVTAQTGNFPAEFELSGLASGDGSVGFVLNGMASGDYSGFSVSAAGDLNADGVGDLLVGARGADPNYRTAAGESYVVYGRDTSQVGNFPCALDLSSLAAGSGSAGFVLKGIDANDLSGFSVSAAGDVSGDGIDDLVIGAIYADPAGASDAGESYVVFGREPIQGGAFPAELELSSLATGDGSVGFVLNGIDEGDNSASSVSAAGDVNGDGIGDLLIGARTADPGGVSRAGETYVVFGRDTLRAGNFPAQFELSTLSSGDGSAGFVVNGSGGFNLSGGAVSAAGDINHDGIDDLVIGAVFGVPTGSYTISGESYVVFGRHTIETGNFPAEFQLSSLTTGDGSAGFVLTGIDERDGSGRSVSGAGDVNGDGIGDLIVGAYGGDPGNRSYAGESYVVFGRDTAQVGNFPAEFDLSGLASGDGSHGFVLNGVDASDYSGWSVSAGDLNGDQINDLIVGANGAASDNGNRVGATYVVFGRADTDADGVLDAVDNCIEVGNADQRDTNGDGIGNLCDADLNNDCTVNFLDLGIMKSVFFSSDVDADLTGDGSVNFSDFSILHQDMFLSPGPSGTQNICDGG